MKITSWEQIKTIVRSMGNTLLKNIADTKKEAMAAADKAQETADSAQKIADKAQETAEDVQKNKMNATNPTGTGYFVLNSEVLDEPGECSHTSGYQSGAEGFASHAEGAWCRAYGYGSHAEGSNTRAVGNYSHVQGKCNIADTKGKYAHIVGNGKSNNQLSNAHTLDWNGNAWFAGDVYVGGTSQDNGEKLVTESELAAAGLPTGGEPHQQLITDKDGETVWADLTHYTEDAEAVVLEQTTLTVNVDDRTAYLTTPPVTDPTDNGRYTVYWNGTEYECISTMTEIDDVSVVLIGNAMPIGGDDTGEPFAMIFVPVEMAASMGLYAMIIPLDGSEEVTVSIAGVSEVVHKLHEKYLPPLPTNIANGSAYMSLRIKSAAEENEEYRMGQSAIALGENSKASGTSSHTEGHSTTASGANSHAEGEGTVASGTNSHTEGSNTTANGIDSHAEGSSTAASGDSSHAEGGHTEASGDYSHAEGGSTKASGYMSHTEGYDTMASGDYSHAEGEETEASGNASHAEGKETVASGSRSHAEGLATTASGEYSHAEGGNTTASGTYSHAEGLLTTASGVNSHAEGHGAVASGDYSHAEGKTTKANGEYSHAEGGSTTASGSMSHTEGCGTTASGYCSHAEGYYTTARGSYSHAQGILNIEDTENKYVHIVGNGTTDARSNAHTLDWDGNAWFAGNVYVGGTSQDDGQRLVTQNELAAAGLPTGGAAHQQLVTDKDGNAKWEDRLCYTEPGIVEVLPEMTLTVDAEIGQALIQSPLNGAIVVGNEYTVTYNGTDYVCVAQDFEGLGALGNIGVMTEGTDTGEPFVFVAVPAGMEAALGGYAMCMCLDGATEVTIKITGQGTIYKRIPFQYIEDMYGTEYGEETVILPETKLDGANGAFGKEGVHLNPPVGRYIVKLNGVSYETRYVFDDDGNWGIGNAGTSGEWNYADVPFLITQSTGSIDGLAVYVKDPETGEMYNGEVTISITHAPATVKKIPEKYIPEKLLDESNEPVVLRIEYGDDLLTGTLDVNKLISVSHTYDEIKRALMSGRLVYCSLKYPYSSGNQYITLRCDGCNDNTSVIRFHSIDGESISADNSLGMWFQILECTGDYEFEYSKRYIKIDSTSLT